MVDNKLKTKKIKLLKSNCIKKNSTIPLYEVSIKYQILEA